MTKTTESKIKCLGLCGKEKAANTQNFYENTNPLFTTEKLPVCKMCIQSYIGEKDHPDFINRVKLTLALLNRPFLPELLERKEGDWGTYIREVSSLPHNKHLKFSDSEFERSDLSFNEDEEEFEDEHLTKDALKRWEGFDLKKISKLESFYQELISTYEHGTPIQRNLYRNITITQIQANEAIANTDHKKYKELMETLSKLMNDANIKPVQETGAEANGISSFGEFMKMIEETEPIPEARDEFKDVDGIAKYIDKYFLHHMKRFLGLTNETMEEYDSKTVVNERDE